MTFRTRLFVAFTATAIIPLVLLGTSVVHELDRRLTDAYERRVTRLAAETQGDVARIGATIDERLGSVRGGIADDNRFRLGAVQDVPTERRYLLDYAAHAMRLSGLAMLQIENDSGRIVSSGHYRNEYDRLEPDLVPLLEAAPGATALVWVRTPDGPTLMFARVDSLQLGGRRFAIVGGVDANPRLLGRLAADSELTVSLQLAAGGRAPPGVPNDAERATSREAIVASFPFPLIATPRPGARALTSARFDVTQSLAGLHALESDILWWCVAAIGLAVAAALVTANWLAARIARPIRALAEQSARVDLAEPGIDFSSSRDDEIGALSRGLAAMMRRLRANAAQVRDAERRAAVGDMARQVTHDVKNGLVPIRHVVRHLTDVQDHEPDRLASVFAERRPTLVASIAYLDELARRYARLGPCPGAGPCDINAVAQTVAAGYVTSGPITASATGSMTGDPASLRLGTGHPVVLQLDPTVPLLPADSLVVRRILENLVANACDAAGHRPGAVTITTQRLDGTVRVTVADAGCGMTPDALRAAFNDFYTTKPNGTGLGLSIVTRLVRDVHGVLRMETAPGAGTRASITFAAPHESRATSRLTRAS
jgi:signal transduction histidine kinase